MRVLALVLLVAAVVAAALPIDDRDTPDAGDGERRGGASNHAAGRSGGSAGRPSEDRPANRARRAGDVPRARCPAEVAGCRAVRGRVLYVERVDPDGDGDLHVVVLDGSITAPGVTAVDVRPGLRPARDPRVGDRVSAAGPVQPGSYGQSQIHAVVFRARRG